MRFTPALVGTGAATALLLALPGPALAAPAAPAAPVPVDAEARVYLDKTQIYPGGTLQVRAITEIESGEVAKVGATLALPAGVTFVRVGGDGDAANADCTPSADGRTVACVPKDGQKKLVSAAVYVKVGADLAPGTKLPFTVTADIGDAVDGKPENNTATTRAEVRAPGDLSLKWELPAGPVRTGTTVTSRLVVTNLGPGPADLQALMLEIGDYAPGGYDDKACWSDPGMLVCDHNQELAPGATVTFPFTWYFPAKAAGTTYKVPARFYTSSWNDPNPANDEDIATFAIKKGPKPTAKPTPTPSTSTSTSPSASLSASTSASASASTPAPAPTSAPPSRGGDDELANTGLAPLNTLAGTAAALAAAGVLLAGIRMRTKRGKH